MLRNTTDESGRVRRKTPAGRSQIEQVLREGVLVALMGAFFAFVANEISPSGLKIAQNYFPDAPQGLSPPGAVDPLAPRPAGAQVGSPSPAERLARRLHAKGLRLVESNRMVQLFRDPRYEQELIVFIDARDDRHYLEGHIPGAYQFDHYRAENYLAAVLPVCQTADQIVVYCTGGDCEDSEFSAIILQQTGIPAEKLSIYGGGMIEWAANGMPVETGGRNSGSFRHAKP